MKNTTRILTITLACFFAAVTGLAQDAAEAHKNFEKLRNNKEAKPSAAYNQTLVDAGMGFLAEHSSDASRTRRTITQLLSYGMEALAKDAVLRTDLFARLNFAIVDKQPSLNDRGKLVFTALSAAVAEGMARSNPTRQSLNDWREQIDRLAAMPNSQSYVLDREKGFYDFMSKARDPRMQRIATAKLEELEKSKDRETANWAKQEIKMNELRTTATPFAFTAFDGKQFDSTKQRGTPSLYVFFWNTTVKNAPAELDKLMDTYFEFSRKQVEFILFCTDPEDKRADVQAAIRKAKIKCPVYFDGQGGKGEFYQKLSSPGMLNGYLFDNAGMLRETNVKPADLKKFIR